MRFYFALYTSIPPARQHLPHNGPPGKTECQAWYSFLGAVLQKSGASLSAAQGIESVIEEHYDLLPDCGECEKQLQRWVAAIRRLHTMPSFYGSRSPPLSAYSELVSLQSSASSSGNTPTLAGLGNPQRVDPSVLSSATYSAHCECSVVFTAVLTAHICTLSLRARCRHRHVVI